MDTNVVTERFFPLYIQPSEPWQQRTYGPNVATDIYLLGIPKISVTYMFP